LVVVVVALGYEADVPDALDEVERLRVFCSDRTLEVA
jgi:hypothetical protein